MRIHLRANSANGVHTSFTVFVNGANCGELTMEDVEAANFYQIVSHGCAKHIDSFKGSGRWKREEVGK